MLSKKEKFDALIQLGIELSQVHDLDILLERILARARQFSNADAGSIYVRSGNQLNFTYTQNETLQRRLPRGEKLIYSTFKIPIDEKSIAGYAAQTGRFINLPDAYRMDSSTPYSFNREFDEACSYRTRSMLTIPLTIADDRVLGVLQLINAQNHENRIVEFSSEDETVMAHFAAIASVALERAQMTRALLLRMIRMSEMRDPKETGAHVNRVAGYSVEIYESWAQRRQIDLKEIERNRDMLRMAAMLHDVGKVAISDLILKKPDRLAAYEFELMKQHTILGSRLFIDRQSDFDAAAAEVALNHHERWNGKGYPGHVDPSTGLPLAGFALPDGSARGKRAHEIPIFGRIVALADVYDALSFARVYKEAWDESKTFSIIEQESGVHFDPELVDIFFSRLDFIRSIQKRYKENDGL